MSIQQPLPPGQMEVREFFRFGLSLFANRFPQDENTIRFEVRGDVATAQTLAAQDLADLPRVDQVSDFHCVTTWSYLNVRWSGVRFADFYRQIVVPRIQPAADATLVVFRGEDGYATSLPLDDLLAADVLLADQVDGHGLQIEHGAPLRLVAPAHYGFKNVKHIAAIEFWRDRRNYRFPFPYPQLMDHPRGRVALEERTRIIPGWLVRYFYRMLIGPSKRASLKALARYRARGGAR